MLVILQDMVILVMFVAISCCGISATNAYASETNYSPIIISRSNSSPQINIVIHAPDFNSNSYAIDTIGEDGSKVVISTRESSIPYRLVETGPDTGDFAGYVVLSSSTSSCSPVCGPTDGFLAANGDDAITVSFTYANGRTVSASSYGQSPVSVNHDTIPEFPFTGLGLLAGMVILMSISKANFIR
jgi:hypothetical protein